MAGYNSNFSQSYRDTNRSPMYSSRSPGRAMYVQGTIDDYPKLEPMVTEAPQNPSSEFSYTQELLQMLDNIRPHIEKSRQEVATAKERMSDASNTTITKQGKEIDELKKKLAEMEEVNINMVHKYRTACDDLEKSKQVNAAFQQKLTEITTEKDHHKSGLDNLSQSNEILKEQLKKIKKEKSKMEEELNNMKTRLSKVLGNKISDNNPDIADLSDMNRPTKIGERYSELYDNEWTDAFEVFHNKYKNDKKCISTLLTVLMMAKKHCDDKAEEQKKMMTQALYFTAVHDDSQTDINKQVKDIRKEAAPRAMQQVQKSFKEDIISQVSAVAKAMFKTDAIQYYMDKCVEICWLMSVQDPPLTFGEARENEAFDTSKYKHYTRTGDRIEYLVWPEMYLKEGALLCKGVAQGAGRVQSARERRRRDENNDEATGRPQTAPPIRKDETRNYQQGYAGYNHQQATHGVTDHVDEKSTSAYGSSREQNATTTNTTQMRPMSVKVGTDYKHLRTMCPDGVQQYAWDNFLYYVARYGIDWMYMENAVGSDFSACLQHYNTICSMETDA